MSRRIVVMGLLGLLIWSRSGGCPVAGEPQPAWTREQLSILRDLALPTSPPPAHSNRVADDPDASELGRELFFDAGLSADGSIACASCHDPERHFTDGKPTAVGLAEVERHTPTVVGAAWYPFPTWDGRRDSLWSQALEPLESPEEMGSHRLLVHQRVLQEHGEAYARVFGDVPTLPVVEDRMDVTRARALWADLDSAGRAIVDEVFVNVGKALEAYQRRLVPEATPFDAYVNALATGADEAKVPFSDAAVRGLRAFIGEAGCIHCHNGPLLSDLSFHNLGSARGQTSDDRGHAAGVSALLESEFRSDGDHSRDGVNPHLRFLAPHFADALGAFKTPSLRNVAATPPYGHLGEIPSLEEWVDSYRGGRDVGLGHLDPLLTQVSEDFSTPDMVEFLKSLTPAHSSRSRWRTPPSSANGEALRRSEEASR